MNGVCQVTQTAITSDSPHDYKDTTYDGMGRVWTVSNPYRTTSDPTYGLTTTTYDALGRAISVANPDTTASSNSYSGLSTTVTDAAGNPRTLVSDELGEQGSGISFSERSRTTKTPRGPRHENLAKFCLDKSRQWV